MDSRLKEPVRFLVFGFLKTFWDFIIKRKTLFFFHNLWEMLKLNVLLNYIGKKAANYD